MVIRRNTRKFKEIESVVRKFAKDTSRKRRIKLFSLKAGDDISKRIDVSKDEVIYNLHYQMLLDYLKAGYTLHASDEKEGLFYFAAANNVIMLPFELNKSLFKDLKTFSSHPAPKGEPTQKR